ncbi:MULTISPECIES: hypothetical protein [unclassified Meiothermus]|uniref:hypothetical protein n=1 Tax=unclassified Meiothermus TaxID=370471 RepID=UPI000D7CA4AE|nr:MULTISPECIES: hypothetical protein [unclassified Meiothermus]PZA07957.1 hypothetical protein DNA98_06575 [Meiothermus sp. Pnk-1]RYM36698.1 hypothetical protein EWH23_08630 [Meiothermus sp. PNK-Is4]
MSIWTIVWWALLAAAAVALWRGTQSKTARAVTVGALLLVAFPDPLGNRSAFWESLGENPGEGTWNGVRVESRRSFCISCAGGVQDGRWRLTARFLSGSYTLSVERPQPYALAFRSGRVLRDGQALTPGCTSGTLEDAAVFDFTRAERVNFRVGAGASCH